MAKPTLLQTLLGRPSKHIRNCPKSSTFLTRHNYYELSRLSLWLVERTMLFLMTNEQTILRTTNDDHNDTAVSFLPPPSIVVQTDDDSDDTDSDDIFYTPNSSPRVSMVSPNLPESIPSTKTWASRSSTSVESVSLDGHSLFSSDSSPSTGITTPMTSEAGDHEPLPRPKRRPSQAKYDTLAQDSQWLGVPTRHNSLRSTQTPKLTRSSSARTSPPSTKPAGNGTRAPIPRSASTRSPSVSRSSSPASRSHKGRFDQYITLTLLPMLDRVMFLLRRGPPPDTRATTASLPLHLTVPQFPLRVRQDIRR
ncbi:hypothetical protein BDZ89DRAFT_269386 [Hymenopellis radicata]|nr:hypothetical protein BDZ89DRAFT_269386 [Hymenopellis radicata]